jgi:hypothetical protein
MVALIEMAEDQEFERQPDQQRGGQRQRQPQHEAAGQPDEGHGQIGAEHVLHAMRQVDEVHHAEDERQPGRDQEQQDAELQAVQDLDDEEAGGHGSHACR